MLVCVKETEYENTMHKKVQIWPPQIYGSVVNVKMFELSDRKNTLKNEPKYQSVLWKESIQFPIGFSCTI